MRKKTGALFSLFIFFLLAMVFINFHNAEAPEQKRERILGELSDAIDEKAENGEYKCCIDPPCTMCYMGGWLWDNGTCLCDEMIASGEDDKVCPQCKKGLEGGVCSSAGATVCPVE